MNPNYPKADNYAFPMHATYSNGHENAYWTCAGMTLRDYFAAKAMQAIVSGFVARGGEFDFAPMARLAYEQADAMLKAREAK